MVHVLADRPSHSALLWWLRNVPGRGAGSSLIGRARPRYYHGQPTCEEVNGHLGRDLPDTLLVMANT